MTAAFALALRGAHVVTLDIDVLDPLTGRVLESLEANDGTVTLDAGAAVRGRLDMSIIDDGSGDLIPTDPDSLLAPYGNEIQVRRGIRFADNTVEDYSLGIFRIEEAPVHDSGDELSVTISGLDRAARIAEAKFEADYQVKPGRLFGDIILELVREVYPDVEASFTASSVTTPAVTASRGEDRWAFCQGLATAIGGELYFDVDGVLVLRPIPGVAGDQVADFTIAEGDGGLLLEVDRGFSRESVYNRVIVTGDGLNDNPVVGIATDDDPASPTYYYGPFGRKPYFYDTQFVTKAVQASDAAEGILQTMVGTDQQLALSSVTDPRVTPSDIIRVTRQRIGVDELHVLDSMSYPLAVSDSSSGTTRKTAVFE